MRISLAFSLALFLVAPVFSQNQPPALPKNEFDPNDDPEIHGELDRIHEELSKVLKQQTEVLRTITSDAGIIPMNGIGGRVRCIGGNCAYERLPGPGRTGLALLPLPANMRAGLRIDADTGILVQNVFPDTPADIAGYMPGDILVSFNNEKVPNDLSTFMGFAALIKNDVAVHGTILRGDKRLEMGEMRLTDQRVIPGPVINDELPPVDVIRHYQPVARSCVSGRCSSSNGSSYGGGNGNVLRNASNNSASSLGNPPSVERYEGVQRR